MSNFQTPEQLNRKADKELRERQKNIYGGTVHDQVMSVNHINEKITLRFRETPIGIRHPHLSINSWIRSTVEVGTSCTTQYSQDLKTPEIASYKELDSTDRLEAYGREKSLYRPLDQGAIDIMSKGMATVYFGKRTVKESTTGVIRSWEDNDTLEHGVFSPIHRRTMNKHVPEEYGDEERLGVVKRKTSPNFSKYPKLEDESFAKEHSFNLKDFNNNELVDFKEGHVFDGKGQRVTSTKTSIPLRLLKKLFTLTGKDLKIEVDEKGNLVINFPEDAELAAMINIPEGSFELTIGKDKKINVSGLTQVITSGDTTIISSKGDVTIDGQKNRILLGQNSTHPLLYGDTFLTALTSFLTKLSAHVHPGVGPSPTIAADSSVFLKDVANAQSRTVTTK